MWLTRGLSQKVVLRHEFVETGNIVENNSSFIFNYVLVTSLASDYVHIHLEVHNKHFFCSEFAKRFVRARTEALESFRKENY